MARPPKDPTQVMTDPLRIPMTSAQKALIREAAELLNLDMAEWSRAILFAQAERALANANPKKKTKKS